MGRKIFILAIAFLMASNLYSQMILPADTLAIRQPVSINQLSDRSLARLDTKYGQLEKTVDKQSIKLLNRMEKQEMRLQKKLQLKDSLAAKQLFADSRTRYEALKATLQSPVLKTVPRPLQEYIPRLDSLQTATRFLGQYGAGMHEISSGKLQQVQMLNQQLQQLQGRMQQAGEIRDFIRKREQQLKDQLTQYGLGKQLLGINKEVYYYQQRLSGYKNTLNDKDKLEETALGLVRQLPAFQNFMQRNSYLSQLFPMPQNYGTTQALAGLQTSSSVGRVIAERIGSINPGTNPQQYLQQQAQAAQDQLTQLKNKVAAAGGGGSDMELPQFAPNTQKLKRFLQRLEYGFNIQSQQTTNFLPATSDLAFTLGYRLNDKSTLGIGAGYKLGLGRGWDNITLSNQGIGVRSYVDIKAKGSLWITGGFEYNYQREFEKLSQIRKLDVWQKSALVGITKKYKAGKKTGNLQLLYDILAAYGSPRGQALKFRVGYGF